MGEIAGVIHTPEGAHVVPTAENEEAAQTIPNVLDVMAQQLAAIARMMDLLVRLECGAIKRKDLKDDILATEEAIRQFQQEQLANNMEAEMDRLAAEQEAETDAEPAPEGGDEV